MLIFLCVPFFISSSYHFEHVLIATKSPRKKNLHSPLHPNILEKDRLCIRSQAPARSLLITLLRLGSFLCRPWSRRIAWKKSVAPGCNTRFPGRYSCLPEGTILLILRQHTANTKAPYCPTVILLSVCLPVLMLDLNLEMWLENPWLLHKFLESKICICN